jgi:hypothetical protein
MNAKRLRTGGPQRALEPSPRKSYITVTGIGLEEGSATAS